MRRVPAGGAVTATRDIVEDATCRKCHMNTPGHYGPWNGIVKACVTCHASGNTLVNSAANGGATNTLEMSVMLHKIHAGRELQSVAGLNGQYYDNPNTPADETADNGPPYQLGALSTWNTAAFPAVLANCQACHTGSAANVDNWKAVPSRAACGSCHDTIVWATGVNHAGGPVTTDDACAFCHPGTGVVISKSVTEAHNWTKKDARNIPEFNIDLTVNTPARGYFVNGESPVISIVLKKATDNTVISPASVIEDGTAEGCFPAGGSVIVNADGTISCPNARDGLFRSANVYVTGPRGQRVPVLSYPARAKATTLTAGPWDLSALTAAQRALRVKVDGGLSMLEYNEAIAYEGYGADELISGDITVTLDNAVLTLDNVVAALNANAAFHERAIAYKDESLVPTVAGRLSIRSRGVLAKNITGEVSKTAAQRNVQIVSYPAGMFDNVSVFGASGTSAQARKRSTATSTDPKADALAKSRSLTTG